MGLLQNVLVFDNVLAGTHSLPHGLTANGYAVAPTTVFAVPTSVLASISADTVNVTIENPGPGAISATVYVQYAHSITGQVGGTTPFIAVATPLGVDPSAVNSDITYRSISAYGYDIQAAIDAGPGTVFIPAGTYVIDEPIILPRTRLVPSIPYNGVKLKGAGSQQVFLVPSASFPANRGVIEWAPASGGSGDPTRLWRAWNQRIEGMTITLPSQPGYGIWYKRTELAFNPSFEKMTLHVEDVVMEAFNDWAQVGIRVEGNVHEFNVIDFTFNIGSKLTGTYIDARAIECDVSPNGNNANDDWGIYSGRIHGLNTTPRSGGWGGVFYGRAQFVTFEDIAVGKGSLGMPQIHLVGSCGVRITNLVTEGAAEQPQILLDDCGDIHITDFNLGTPTPQTIGMVTYPVGNGIELVNGCYGCEISHWTSWVNKQLWDVDLGVARVVIGADCVGNVVNITTGGGAFGNEDPYAVIVDNAGAGGRNRIVSRNVSTGVFTRRYNGSAYSDDYGV